MNRKLGIGLALLFAFTFAGAQNWAPLNNQPPFLAGTALLLTDGTVMVQEMQANGFGTGNWWRLIPDSSGSYRNGTWSQRPTMPAGHAPLYYASAVLPDGRVVVVGGEHNNGVSFAETAMGSIYDPVANTWASIQPPNGVGQIGDAAGIVLPNGNFMIAPCCNGSKSSYLLDSINLTWTLTGAGKNDVNSEEGWTLLPNGNVLTVDTTSTPNSEVYSPVPGSWSSAGSTIVSLPSNSGLEIGPAVLRTDGTVFAAGGNSNTAIYNSNFGGWSVGPQIPNGWNAADVPAALLPGGNVLLEVAETFLGQGNGIDFYEFNGNSLNPVASPPNAAMGTGFQGRMLVLPTGEVLFTNQTTQVQLYTSNLPYQAQWQPTISAISSSSLGIGLTNYTVFGTQFNGLSQGAMYGDDAQSATNYPLIRVTNNATGHVFYLRTHDHSTMAVATGSATVSTMFDVPANVELGDSMLQVVVNGIPSDPRLVTVFAPKRRACCTF